MILGGVVLITTASLFLRAPEPSYTWSQSSLVNAQKAIGFSTAQFAPAPSGIPAVEVANPSGTTGLVRNQPTMDSVVEVGTTHSFPALWAASLLAVVLAGALKTWTKRSTSNVSQLMEVPLHAISTAGIPEMKVAYYDDLGFQALTLASFPEKAVASPDEARVLWAKGGYDILDVRSDFEREDRGPIRAEKGSVNIPMFFAKYVYDPAANKKVVKQEVNPKWLDQVRARFPSKDAKIIIMCSDGRQRALQALELMDGEGYTHLVGLRGGFNNWDEVFDRYLRRRDVGVATEVYNHVDSEGNTIAGCGIHASGAAFEMVDSLKMDKISSKDPVPWADWSEAVQQLQGQQIAMFATTGVPEMKVAYYDDPGFQVVTLAAFPEKAVASPDEARVLWAKGGYDILDVRSDFEREDRGPIRAEKGSVNIPMFFAKYVYDPAANKKVVKQEVNPKWLDQVRARFPSKDAKIIIMCSDGRRRALQALELLDGEGYTHLVGLRGGFNNWDEVFDRYLRRRDVGVATEVYNHVDSEGNTIAGCGIHASGAAFEMVDSLKMDKISPKDPVPWADWSEAVQQLQGQQIAMFATTGVPEMKVAYYDDPGFQAVTLAAFPEKAVASPDEARVLWAKGGYDILDVRSDFEREDRGPIRAEKGSVNIPMFFAKYVYDPAANKKVVKQEVNPKWLDQVRARFPSKDAKIIIMCSDGRRRALQALELLDGEGYTHLVGLRGGFNNWDEVFDRYLRRRDVGVATEVYNHVDSEGNTIAGCGIHASGAAFEMVDSLKMDKISPKDPVPWADWSEAVQQLDSQRIAMFTTTGAVAEPVVEPVPLAQPVAEPVVMRTHRFDDAVVQDRVLREFPDKTIANCEEARILWQRGGYELVDIRSDWEREDIGRITADREPFSVPLIISRKEFDEALGQNKIVQEPNPHFLEQIQELFLPSDKFILMDSDGRDRTSQALGLLQKHGFTDACGLRGGFNVWNTAFDADLRRRFPDIEDVKELEAMTTPDPIQWQDWAVAMDPCPLEVFKE